MSGIQFLSKILGLVGLVIRKDPSNRQVRIDLSSYQGPNTDLSVLLPYRDGTLLLSPETEGTVGQVLATDADGTTSWVSAILASEKGVANGIASLGADGLVPSSQLPPTSNAVNSVNGETGTVVLSALDVGAIPYAEKGAASGVASLGSDGIVPYSQLPQIPGVAAPIDFYGSIISDSLSGSVFTLNSTIYKSFIAQISVFLDGSSTSESFMIVGANNGSEWIISPTSAGQNSEISFSISSVGVLSFSDASSRTKTISYYVQAIDKSLESYCKKQEKGSVSSGLSSGTVFTINSNMHKSFMAQVSVFIDAPTDLAETFIILGASTGDSWLISQITAGDKSDVSFSIDSNGVLSFSDPAARAKVISYQYEAIDNFIGRTSTAASSGSLLKISPAAFRSFTAQVFVFVDDVIDLAETFYLIGANNGTNWLMSKATAGQNTGIDFSINSSGVLSFSDPSAQIKQISFRVSPITI